ncbi:MAG TPA: serine hydrolase domain-containing protein [Bryobacteraceae bacterium]|nr:serine hydrolase domain-containing protein [Bryobacteraceae bacterium]
MNVRFSSRILRVLFALAAAIACLPAAGQGLPTAKPEEVGLSAVRLERIGAAVQREIEAKRIAGAVTLVARKGRVAWLKAQGMADVESGKPMQTDNIFRICSMTKPITSLAVMMLYEEGRFLLNDPVSKYLPEFKNPKVLVKPAAGEPYTIPAAREITIKHLLNHTSGLVYHWNPDLGPRYRDAGVAHGLLQYDGTIAESVKRLAAQPLLFHPGDKYEYSLSIDVLGRLVEVVSGKSLDEFFRTRIFEPLGMKDTHFYLPSEKVSRLASVYMRDEGKAISRFPAKPIVEGPFEYSADYPYRGPKTLFSGGAGLNSTAADYGRFCQMMLNGGVLDGKRLLSRKTVELMTHDQLGKVAPDLSFGLGFGVSGGKVPMDELGSPGLYGWGGFYYTVFFIDPKEQLVGVFMAQLHPTGGLNLDGTFQVLASQAVVE